MRHRPLDCLGPDRNGSCPLLLLLLLSCCLWLFCTAQEMPPSTLEDHPLDHHSRHHSLMGPCLDRGQFCDKLKRFCNDFKYQTLMNKECRATCNRC